MALSAPPISGMSPLPVPNVDPFGAFIPPPTPPITPVGGPQIAAPAAPGIGGATDTGGGGWTLPGVHLDGPLALAPAAQSPLGGTGNTPAPQAAGGADYPPFTNDATGRVGDSPYRRVKRGGFQPMPSAAPGALPDGMRAI